MLMRVREAEPRPTGVSPRFSELQGSKVAVLDVSADLGGDVALAFADHGARLHVSIRGSAPETDALLSVLAAADADLASVQLQDGVRGPSMAATTADAAKAEGHLDAAIHCVALDPRMFADVGDFDELEAALAASLGDSLRAAEVAVNRMGLVWARGAIITLVRMPVFDGPAASVFSGITRHAISAATRDAAIRAADLGVRLNTIFVAGDAAGEPTAPCAQTAADLALYLASTSSAAMNGMVFDAKR
ncbi:MAG: SDR family oxidoreductase [Pseudomonadota bacterium]